MACSHNLVWPPIQIIGIRQHKVSRGCCQRVHAIRIRSARAWPPPVHRVDLLAVPPVHHTNTANQFSQARNLLSQTRKSGFSKSLTFAKPDNPTSALTVTRHVELWSVLDTCNVHYVHVKNKSWRAKLRKPGRLCEIKMTAK